MTATPLSAPEGAIDTVAALLNAAHAELPVPELAEVLIALKEPADQLVAAGRPAGEAPRALSPPAMAVALLIRRLLDQAGSANPPEGRRLLGGWLVGYLDEVAARPPGRRPGGRELNPAHTRPLNA